MKKEIPIWEKTNLTLQEAAEYTGIGVNKLRNISNAENCGTMSRFRTTKI